MNHEYKDVQRWFEAARRDDVSELQRLRKKCIKSATASGMTALMIASCNGARNAVLELGRREAGMRSKSGYTALMLAALRDERRIVQFLSPLEGNAVLAADTEDFPAGSTALIMALSCGHVDLIELLQNEIRLSKLSAFHLACARGDWDACLRYMDMQALTDAAGRTGLHYLAMRPHSIEQGEVLSRASSRCLYEVQDKYGFTAVHYAAAAGNAPFVLQAVLKNVFLQFGSGETSYAKKTGSKMRASQDSRLYSVHTGKPLLLQFGSNLTPLMVAVAHGHRQCAQQFSEHFTGVETSCGFTALSIGIIYDAALPQGLEDESRALTRQSAAGIVGGSSVSEIIQKRASEIQMAKGKSQWLASTGGSETRGHLGDSYEPCVEASVMKQKEEIRSMIKELQLTHSRTRYCRQQQMPDAK